MTLTSYNEVLVATPGWEAKLPGLIEAFVWIDDGVGGGGGGGAEAEARGVHASFLRHFPQAAPRLVRLDLSRGLDEPFAEAAAFLLYL